MHLKLTRQVIGLLVFVATLMGCDASVSVAKNSCPEGAQQFWKKLRYAVLQSNTSGVAELALFPFTLSSGVVDADRKNIPIQRAEFIKKFPHLLTHDPGLSLDPSTMWDLINSVERLTGTLCAPDGEQFRVGNWVFQNNSQSWRFVQAYVGKD